MRSDTTIRRETDIRQKILLHKIKIDQIQEEKMKYYIGVDLGTSAVKLLLMDQYRIQRISTVVPTSGLVRTESGRLVGTVERRNP